MVRNSNILISGAGIAGLTIAYFLKKYGFDPVVIEKSNFLRDNERVPEPGKKIRLQMSAIAALIVIS